MEQDREAKLWLVGFAEIETERFFILKRGVVELRLAPPTEAKAVLKKIQETIGRNGTTEDDLLEHFPKAQESVVRELLATLMRSGLLVSQQEEPSDVRKLETPESIFYWQLGTDKKTVAARMQDCRFVIVGVNTISRWLLQALMEQGVEHVTLVDAPELRNYRYFSQVQAPDNEQVSALFSRAIPSIGWTFPELQGRRTCLVGTSDLGGLDLLRPWNRMCVEKSWFFFPVVLQDLIGYIGPLVHPGETACFECLMLRQNAHLDTPSAQRAIEQAAPGMENGSSWHPALASVIGNLAGIELTKFFGLHDSFVRFGALAVANLIEINVLSQKMTGRPVLKVPRCAVCGDGRRRVSTDIHKKLPIPLDNMTIGGE